MVLIAVVLIVGPFFSPFIAPPLAQKVRGRMSFCISKQLKIALDTGGQLNPWVRQLRHPNRSRRQGL